MGSLVLCLAASGVIFVAAKLGKLDTEEIDAADIQVNKEAEETGVNPEAEAVNPETAIPEAEAVKTKQNK